MVLLQNLPPRSWRSLGVLWLELRMHALCQEARLLRAHRKNMRVMEEFIQERGLEEELEQRMIDETGNTNFWLGHIDYMDEDSEQEDPEAALRQELADKSAFVEAAAGVLQYSKMAADLEHARLMLEDVRSQQLR